MNKDEIIRMFHEAGALAGWKPGAGNPLVISYLTHFATLVESRFEDALRAAETALDSPGLGKKTREDALRIVRETLYDC